MRKLVIPEKLKIEFATVELLWRSSAETRRTDSLLLSWIKHEKQLRRLFCFLIFQHASITRETIESVIAALAENKNLNPETFLEGIRALGVTPVPQLLGAHYPRLWPELTRIKKARNKLMHGQITGKNLSSDQLEQDVLLLIDWISRLADGAQETFGYDGLRRNTYIAAKSVARINITKYPFADVAEFKRWLSTLVQKGGRRLNRYAIG